MKKYVGQTALSTIFSLLASKFSELAKIATSGSYNDLADKPSITTYRYQFSDTATADITEEQDIRISITFAETSVKVAPNDICVVSYEGLTLRRDEQYTINFNENTITLLGFKRKVGETLFIELYKLALE